MKAYRDKVTGKWKWGTRGQAIHESKHDAEIWAMSNLAEKLKRIRNKLNGVMGDHGK